MGSTREPAAQRTPTFTVLYGFCEGPHIGRHLVGAMRAEGFRYVRDPAQADVILAHSGGCFVVPPELTPKLIVLIGLPCSPGTATHKALRRKILQDVRVHRQAGSIALWLSKTWWNAVYFCNVVHTWRMFRGQRRQGHRPLQHVVLIRNRDDVLCTPDASQFHFATPPALVSLPGQHDDCWLTPEPYAKIARRYYYGT